MKKISLLLLVLVSFIALCSCGGDDSSNDVVNPTTNPTPTPETPVQTEPVVDLSSYWTQEYNDDYNEITVDSLEDTKVFYDGSYLTKEEELVKRKDIKYEFYTEKMMRFVNSSEGYAITIPSSEVTIDYSISSYRTQLLFNTSTLTVSYEDSNPYGDSYGSWMIYLTEWLDRYISNEIYLEQNNLEYTAAVMDSTTFLEGYQVIRYSIYIKDSSEIEKPYYNIAIVRDIDCYYKFFLFVMKSENEETTSFDKILKSFKQVSIFGRTKNHVGQYELKANPNWNSETKAYYEKLNQKDTFEFGFFNYSLDDENYYLISSRLIKENNRLYELTNYHQSILPTYNHLSWGETKMYFPTRLANTFAGGNGFDDKAVLQFTLQYTNNNNNVNTANKTENYTPMFDILRGKYDEQFHELAQDIKAYGKPVLFRLNNEMNSDWTSYCGLITLIDPDIFKLTWIRLYEIFEEEGVDNCIWIFNPIAVTCPFSSWGEDLCYMPGVDYVQALGITRYEMMNDDVVALSFKEGYSLLYDKNKDHWMNYPWIMSEFGCASGGETTGKLYRNHEAQAEWVKGMFECLKDKENNLFCSRISGAVWFNCDDMVDGKIENALHLDSSLTQTFEELKIGLSYFN